jgi:hypothetical protein
MKHLALFTLALCIGALGCKKEDPGPQPEVADYSRGVLVANEGPTGGTGTVTWHDPADGTTVQDVFGKENGGAVLGQYVQSINYHNGNYYVVVNGANRVVVVDARTFHLVDTIGGLQSPRYFQAVDNQYAYVSQWGADNLTGSVAKVDLTTNQIVKTIPTGHGAEKMTVVLGKFLWVVNVGGYGSDSTVTVVDLEADSVFLRKALPEKNPVGLALTSLVANEPFVLARGEFAVGQSWLGTPGGAYSFSGLPQGADDLCVAPGGLPMYFAAAGGVYSCDGTAVQKLFDQPAYGFGCDPATGNLYCADPKDYSSAGEVVVYTPGGQRVRSFPVGLIPGEFLFRN